MSKKEETKTEKTPGVFCCWANLPSPAALPWYEDTYLPSMRTKNRNSACAVHCEVTATGMEEEPVGKLTSPWPYMTVYEMPDIAAASQKLQEPANWPAPELYQGVLKDARFDVRSYKTIRCWEDEEWDGNPNDIISVAVLEWHVTDPAFTEEILNYYTSTVGPMMCSSPTVLRFRFCEIEDAVEQTNDTNFAKSTKPMHKYFSIAEMAEESWPWDVIVEMAEDGKWAKYFESQTVAKWQSSHFLVKKVYTDEQPDGVRPHDCEDDSDDSD